MPLSAAFRLRLRLQPKKIEDNTYGSWLFAPQTNVIYLLLSSSNSLYLQSKRNFRKLNHLSFRAKPALPFLVPDAAGFAGAGIAATTAAVADIFFRTAEASQCTLANDAVVLQLHHEHRRGNICLHIQIKS